MSILSLFHIASPFLRSNCLEEKNVYEDFICSVCLDLCNTPVVTLCNHISCYKCLYYSLLHKKTCPICKQPIGQNNVKQLTGAKRRQYERMRIKCELCEKVIRIKDYQRHKDLCEYKRCKNFILGCEYFDRRNKISAHEEHCEHILTSCSSCSNLFHFKNRVFVLDLKERGSDSTLCVNAHIINSLRNFREMHDNVNVARSSWNNVEGMNVHFLENTENLQNGNTALRRETGSDNTNVTNMQTSSSKPGRKDVDYAVSDIQNYNRQGDGQWKTMPANSIHNEQKSEQISEMEKENMTRDQGGFAENVFGEEEDETGNVESDEGDDSVLDDFINILPLRKKFSFKESNGKDIITIIEELFQFDEVDISNIYVEHTDMFLCNKNCFNDTIKKLRFELEKASSLLNFCCCIGMPIMFTLGGISYLITRGVFKFSIFLTGAFINISHKLFLKIFKT